MKIFPKQYLTDEDDLKMHDELMKQFQANVDRITKCISEDFIARHGEPSPDQWEEIRNCATAISLREMPARLQLMKMYFLQSHVVGKLKEAAEADPENEYKMLCHDAEEATRVALLRYVVEMPSLEDEECDCPDCVAEREAREQFEDRTGLSLPDVSVMPCPEGMKKTGAYVMPMEGFDGKLSPEAIPAKVTHAFRCKSCGAINEKSESCPCGSTEFTPAVIVDLPVEQMDQLNEMKKAEAEHHAQPGNKVVH